MYSYFRDLDEAEVVEFRRWARYNYSVGSPIKEDIWHPVVCEECRKMNAEWEQELLHGHYQKGGENEQ